MPLGCKFDSHRLDKVNFSHPCIRTKALEAKTSAVELNSIFEEDAVATSYGGESRCCVGY